MSSEAPTPMMPKAANATLKEGGRRKRKPSRSCADVTAYGVVCRAITATMVVIVNAATRSVETASTKR
jgi:hypothetical protein